MLQSLWNGELCHEATSILHQHAVQSGVSELQLAVIQWLAFSHIPSIDPHFLLKQLSQLEAAWGEQKLTGEEVNRQNKLLINFIFFITLYIVLGKLKQYKN